MFALFVSTTLVTLLTTSANAQWTISMGGSTGVSAMQLTVATSTNVVILDKFENNPLHDENDKPVWGSIYSTVADTARPLHIVTNGFCATGTWLSNGTLINLGGNPRVDRDNHTSPNGLQGVRLFNPCADHEKCDFYESPYRIRMTSPRWYPSSARLPDGSSLIFGGAYGGGWTNFDALNNPTYEFYPPKNINGFNGVQIPSQFLIDSLPHNMFPHMMLLPDNRVFIAANNMAMILNWERNTEQRLPNMPFGQRVTYPMSGAGVLLPLSYENNYRAEVALFGGSELPDTLMEYQVSSKSPTSSHVARMVLDAAGIEAGWMSEEMPEGRVMPDAVILPDGKILLVNGAKTGVAGYGNVPDQIGSSNADNPAYTPVLYDPKAAVGRRFNSTGMPVSSIPRLYHSVATLLPDGRVMIAGSNPNENVETRTYRTEYQVEYINPPYMFKKRPVITGLPDKWNFGQTINVTITLPPVLILISFFRHSNSDAVFDRHQLPDNRLFMAANSKAMLFNWQTNTETRLPDLPNKQIVVYPMSAPAVLLPLTWENNYKPEVVIFGGSQLADTVKENEVSSQSPTSAQASRIALDAAGIAAGWSFDTMPEGRVMADAVLLPDGTVFVVNGAKTGTAGYGNVPDQIGQSNADNPAFTPVIYNPAAAAGSRFSSAGLPTSNIARLYHSVATLLPDGRVMVTGSNPNADVETRPYKTEYQVEYFSPPYTTKTRPTYSGLPATWNFGQNITLTVTMPATLNPPTISCNLMDLGFSTHGVHMDMRMVKLKCTLSSNRKSLTITGPPNAAIYPPGPAWLYVVHNGVPSKAQKVLIGNGGSPPVNQGAID
ncbi:unnamed protein product, partial [Rhizoctonia solani]